VSAHTIVNTVRAVARDEVDRRPYIAIAEVTSIHGGTDAHACSVKLRETGVVLPKVPIAVGVLGYAALPSPGDLAVVAFAGGDLHAPVAVGFLYDDKTSPPEHGEREAILSYPGGESDTTKVVQLALKAPDADTRSLVVTIDGSPKVEASILHDSIVLAAGDAKLTLDGGGKGTFEVGDAKIELKKDGNITIEAGQKLTLKATQIEITGDATVKVAGQTIDLN
jgi:phage baseplate assembly protein gpV